MATPKPFKFGPNQKKWLHMLKTTKRKQAQGQLYDSKKNGFCCLGIGEVSLGKKPSDWESKTTFCSTNGGLSENGRRALGLRESMGFPNLKKLDREMELTHLNDGLKWSFKKIAKHLRENPRAYFSRSK